MPKVAIIGRPNVGKSTVFNRIIGQRNAIVSDEVGVTRDRLYSKATWLTREFNVIDTGGITLEDHPFREQIKVQAEIAINEADVILFVCDGRTGVTNDDELIARILQKSNKPVILGINKIDDQKFKDNIYEFYSLGLGDPIPMSAVHGIGIGDILDEIIHSFKNDEEIKEDEDTIKFCLIGRPNVGKSSLVNAILNEDRVIVSNIEGTTRDAIDTKFTRNDQNYIAIDTAGLKKRGRIFESIDKYAALRSLGAIDRSDVVLLVIDAETGIREQDKNVAGYAFDAYKGIVIVVNKWDTVKKDEHAMQEFTKKVRAEFKFLDYAPIVFTSALTKSRIQTVIDAIDSVYNASLTRVQTSVLNGVFMDAQQMNPAPEFNGGRIKIMYGNQVATKPPTFVLFVNNPNFLHFSYKRYLENRLRESFNFDGTPIKLIFRNSD